MEDDWALADGDERVAVLPTVVAVRLRLAGVSQNRCARFFLSLLEPSRPIAMNGLVFRGPKALNPPARICHSCRALRSTSPRHHTVVARPYTLSTRPLKSLHTSHFTPRNEPETLLKYPSLVRRKYSSSSSESTSLPDPNVVLNEIETSATALRSSDAVPSNEAVVQVLQKCQALAEVISQPTNGPKESPRSTSTEENEITSLLNLEEKNTTRKPSKTPRSPQPPLADALCRVTHDLLTDEKIFISPEALACYVKIHVLLKRPESFPEIFNLYARKPVPEENSSPVKLHRADPKNINSAIPIELADMALDVAIEQRNLPLVLAIIDNTFCAPAFHRAKFFKKAAVPLGGLAVAPAACYVLASWAASLQSTMDPSTATGIAFAAILAYVGGTSSVGLLAITTANDHMERVVWLPGIPLRHRWLREEERAALDRVALAWGFKEEYMRGEEEGEEWENLREFIGMRGMILDKTDLMKGMQ